MRALLAGLAVLALAAGCGGTEQTAATVAPDVAAMAPASAPLVLAFHTDPESEQWQRAEALLDRFPGKQRLLDELRSGLAEEGVDPEEDLLPALGDDTYVVFLDLEDGGENIVVLTEPRDPAKLQQLLEDADEPTASRVVDGWTLIAEDEALLDRFTADGEHLADADWFADAQEKVEEDALFSLLADGAALDAASRESLPAGCDPPETELEFATVSLVAEEDGVRVHFAASGEGLPEAGDGDSLLSRVPAGALFYLGDSGRSAAGLGGAGFGFTDQLRCASDGEGLPDVERFLGVSYDDILALFADGWALSVKPAALVPEATLLLTPADEAKAVATLDRLAARAASSGLGELRPRTVDGVAAKELSLGPVTILYGAADGRVAVTTASAGLATLTGDIDSLADDERFRTAVDAAGVDADDVVAYVDIARVIELIDGLSGLAGEDLPADAQANLEPLRSVIAWGDPDGGNDVEGGVFLEIR